MLERSKLLFVQNKKIDQEQVMKKMLVKSIINTNPKLVEILNKRYL